MPNRLPGKSEELALLRSIDATLRELLALSKSKRAAEPAVASALAFNTADLDSEFGDEVVKAKMPRDWTGDDFKGSRMSQCPVELLDLLASRHDYFAEKNESDGERQKAGYERRSARRARGWAARKRAGWKPPVEDNAMAGQDDIRW